MVADEYGPRTCALCGKTYKARASDPWPCNACLDEWAKSLNAAADRIDRSLLLAEADLDAAQRIIDRMTEDGRPSSS